MINFLLILFANFRLTLLKFIEISQSLSCLLLFHFPFNELFLLEFINVPFAIFLLLFLLETQIGLSLHHVIFTRPKSVFDLISGEKGLE